MFPNYFYLLFNFVELDSCFTLEHNNFVTQSLPFDQVKLFLLIPATADAARRAAIIYFANTMIVVDMDEAAVVGGLGVDQQGRNVVQVARRYELARAFGAMVVVVGPSPVNVKARHIV